MSKLKFYPDNGRSLLDILIASEEKHTPGPWSISDDGCFLLANADEPIADLRYFHGPDNVGNARLIAAAPDLLASIVELLDHPQVPADSMSDAERKELWRRRAACFTAIDKATGAA